MPDLGKLSSSEFKRWIDIYNSVALDVRVKPSQDVINRASLCNKVVCSDLSRSLESAKLLGLSQVHCISAIFREFELPYGQEANNRGWLKLTPAFWFVCYRILWFLGYSCHCESLSTARNRAKSAADILHEKAIQGETVLFVGHSLLNFYIAKNLTAKGWQGSISLFSKYWDANEFTF